MIHYKNINCQAKENVIVKKSYLKYITALLLFGMNGIVAGNIHLNSYEIVLLRTLLGSLLLVALLFITKKKMTWTKNKKDLIYIAVSGIAMGVSWMFLYEAYAQIGVSISSLLYYSGPVIVMVLSPLLFKEKLTAFKIIGFVAVLVGIFFVNNNTFSVNGNTFGILCGLLSAVLYAIMVIANKKATHIKGLENSAIQLIISFLTVFIFVAFKNGFSIHIDSSDWIWILILGLLNTGAGCYFYFSSIGNLPVQTVAICGYIEPLSAVLFSVILLHETMVPMQIIGAILIIGGAVFGECAHFKAKKMS